MSSDDENNVISKALLRGVRNGSLRNPLRGPFALLTQLIELSYLVANNSLFEQEYPTTNKIFAHDEKYSIVQRLLVTVYHILCNTVYFIIKQAYGFLGEKKETSKSSCTPCILSPFFPSFWALSSKISFFSGQILSRNV